MKKLLVIIIIVLVAVLIYATPQYRRGGERIGSERIIYSGVLDGNHVTVWKIRTSDYRTLLITTGNNGNISVIEPR
ncbi:MAG: hypothetical protein J6I84_04560 [Bacilli bacterium]|nr:hypothetical protein [Bacilli bacterium]